MEYKKFLILENDIESQGLPDVIEDILERNPKMKSEVWWWFKQDVIQNAKKSFKRFASVTKDTFIISQPSFIGWDNSFDGNLHLFKELMNAGIKLSVGIAYYPDFYWFLLKWIDDTGYSDESERDKKKDIKTLKEVLAFHDIYRIDFTETQVGDKPFFWDCMKKITWDWLEENIYKEGEKVKVKSTGKIKTVYSVCINSSDPEKSYISIEINGSVSTANNIKLTDIEKIKK